LLKIILSLLNLIDADRSENADYKGSGYDRGHLAAAGNHKVEQKHMEQTFFLSNMAPQVGVGFNRDSWNRLEKHVRKLTNVYKDVYVCTGPLYLPKCVYFFRILYLVCF
jgi:endonuclease G